ncbi:hypothetical protein HK100_008399 [Physocladia obscura]|uniref:Enoyl reductase (ER) domain-containing protein n=1 Tax=Physocladia obscura TaxID=109957 RepID=A0AAD5SQR2_9FUNG|nr:hypothetical protein HK100_008399 [Physocladia obscura]
MTHQAAIGARRGKPFVVQQRPTPTPGPGQVLVTSKALALNPVDYIMRDMGFNVASFPVVLGSDAAGIITKVGPDVTNLKVGDRVLAYCQAFNQKGAPDFGAFQETVLVPIEFITPIPKSLSYIDAAALPLAIYTVATGYFVQLKVPRAGYKPEDKKAMLVWGAGGSIGTVAVQVAKILGFTVYATASAKHHDYLQSLGAHACFDYKDADVVSQVVKAIKRDGLSLASGYLATGDLKQIVKAVGHFKSPNSKVVAAPFSLNMLWWRVYDWGGVAVEFVARPPAADIDEYFKFVYTEWLKNLLDQKLIVASPKIELFEGGLGGIQTALGKLKSGVSGVKLVVEL